MLTLQLGMMLLGGQAQISKSRYCDIQLHIHADIYTDITDMFNLWYLVVHLIKERYPYAFLLDLLPEVHDMQSGHH